MAEVSRTEFNNLYYNQYQTNDTKTPQRRNKVYYGSGAPPEKRGKEISEEDYKKLENTRLGGVKSLKLPKASQIKKAQKAFEEWFERYVQKPHRYTIEDVQNGVDTALMIKDKIIAPNNNKTDNRPVLYANG